MLVAAVGFIQLFAALSPPNATSAGKLACVAWWIVYQFIVKTWWVGGPFSQTQGTGPLPFDLYGLGGSTGIALRSPGHTSPSPLPVRYLHKCWYVTEDITTLVTSHAPHSEILSRTYGLRSRDRPHPAVTSLCHMCQLEAPHLIYNHWERSRSVDATLEAPRIASIILEISPWCKRDWGLGSDLSWLSVGAKLVDCEVLCTRVPTERLHYRPAPGNRKNSTT
jgi:hypothetical protein